MRRSLTAFFGFGLAASLSFALGAPPIAHAQHDDAIADTPGSVEHAEAAHHTPEINWTASGVDEEGNPLPPPMAGLFLSFAIWLWLIVYFARKPLADFLGARRRTIVDGLEEAQRIEAAAQAKHAEYTARIENLDAEIAKLREDFRRAGMEERDRMVAAASERAHKMHIEAQFLVQQQVKSLREELTREAIEAAVGAAEKILRERATAADQQRLADEYLARLRSSVGVGTSVGTTTKGAS